MTTTIVTCYFSLNNSKHDKDDYYKWMKNMLMMNENMIIYCDKKSYDYIYKLRKIYGYEKKTKMVEFTFSKFFTFKYKHNFAKHHKMDPEHNIHTPYLYMIWNEKTRFLLKSSLLNPFNTDFFIWCDIGCFRKSYTYFSDKHVDYDLNMDLRDSEDIDDNINKWINKKKLLSLPVHKMWMLQIDGFDERELKSRDIKDVPSLLYKNKIGGTIFGGRKNIIQKYHDKYYQMLDDFFKYDIFAGKDQTIMSYVYIFNDDLVYLIKNKKKRFKDHELSKKWFYLQEYFYTNTQ